MSFLDNLFRKNDDNNDRYLDDDYDDNYGYDDEPSDRGIKKPAGKLSGLFGAKVIDGAPQGMQLVTIRPNALNDYKEIIDYLLDGRIVVLNMEGVSSSLAQRIIDFTYGGVYAIDGNFQGINNYIFVATPRSVDVSGDFVEDVVTGNGSGNLSSAPKYQQYNGFRYND